VAAEGKPSSRADVAESGAVSEARFSAALLTAYRELELPTQFGSLIDCAAEWTGAACGIGLGAAEARRVFIPLVATFSEEDPRFAAFTRLHPERLTEWLPEGCRVFKGLGPFAAITTAWPGERPAHVAAFPVLGPEDRWAGVLLLMYDEQPDPARIQRVAELIVEARPAVGNALKLLSLRELVIKDDTANCFNRRHFEEFLPEELSRASRFRSPVSLIFLDMDNLKQVNNDHGHSMGSRTLFEVSVRIRAKIRRFDKLFRFGGDEFCIVLPETEWHGAMEVAERVRDEIASKPFLVRDLRDANGVRMSASLGIASFPLHARTREELVQAADRAMQQIKRGTKNAIGIAEIIGGEDGA
jgi:diguanylate cyclase (GGDEF)-like protein